MQEFERRIFGERLKMLRTEKNIGQNELARVLNLSNASISYWETGKQSPTADAIFKIAQYFNVSADYLIGLKNDW